MDDPIGVKIPGGPGNVHSPDAETERLREDAARAKNWKRWGPYLSERQWGTVREDYSPDGSCWSYLTHDQARSRAYRWGEDGLLGITDRECRLCFSLALWNEKDRILKERLFGLTGPEGNHGEDVKEHYFYLESLPTYSYFKALYKYPHREFPYQWLVDESKKRGRKDPEFELADTGVFEGQRYFDVYCEYAKNSPNDILIRVTIANRGPEAAPVHLLPTIWFRNTWSWGRKGEAFSTKPNLVLGPHGQIVAGHPTLKTYFLHAEPANGASPMPLFTENQTNIAKLFGSSMQSPFVKDSFHERVINGRVEVINAEQAGTKAAFWYQQTIPAGGSATFNLRLSAKDELPETPFGSKFGELFETRTKEVEAFYKSTLPLSASPAERAVMRQAYAGLLWSKQFYYYSVKEWLEGDPAQPKPDPKRAGVRNTDWRHLYNRDIISMPDKWEYPWYAAWDLAFHMIPISKIDPMFAKEQLVLLLREWYMHPNGQIPAYEFAFSDVNPPVHAWACWRTYKITAPRGERDRYFLGRVFHKLLLNFTWWVNRKDIEGNNLFSGGFLGLDNIGVFDRSQPLPRGGYLEQADGTAWMAFYCATMLSMALELANQDPSYDDVASKFFEHFIAITDAMNSFGGTGLWDEKDGFYYDQLHVDNNSSPLRTRSIVGLIPLLAVEVLEDTVIDRLPGFKKRMQWFLEERKDLAKHITYMEHTGTKSEGHSLLAVPSKERLERVLSYVLDEEEFLSPYGIRSLSKYHEKNPFHLSIENQNYRVDYEPGESTSAMFGGNSNWRGPVWFPINYLLIEALERYHHFYGNSILVQCPSRTGPLMNLKQVSRELARRLSSLFVPNAKGRRPCNGEDKLFTDDPFFKDLILFHEYFHGDSGRGAGASHQTGWTALVTRCIERTGE